MLKSWGRSARRASVKQLYCAPVFEPPSALPDFSPEIMTALVTEIEAVHQAANALPQLKMLMLELRKVSCR